MEEGELGEGEESGSELGSLKKLLDSPFVGIMYEVNYCPTPSGPRGHVLVERHLHQKKPSAKKNPYQSVMR